MAQLDGNPCLSESDDLVRAGLRWPPPAPSSGDSGAQGPSSARSLGAAESEEAEGVKADHYLLQDSYPRFLKSDMYKGLLAEAVIPVETKRR